MTAYTTVVSGRRGGEGFGLDGVDDREVVSGGTPGSLRALPESFPKAEPTANAAMNAVIRQARNRMRGDMKAATPGNFEETATRADR
jgi:hypothetical protein